LHFWDNLGQFRLRVKLRALPLATIENRLAYQYRVKIRRKGLTQTRTFETESAAID
jgi:hypothetical protein